MNIRLITRHLDRSQSLIHHAQRRAGYAFSRFNDVIREVHIRLNDVNGPRGGFDIACMARIRLVDGGDILVQSVANSPEHGINQAIELLAQRMRRFVSRRKDHC